MKVKVCGLNIMHKKKGEKGQVWVEFVYYETRAVKNLEWK